MLKEEFVAKLCRFWLWQLWTLYGAMLWNMCRLFWHHFIVSISRLHAFMDKNLVISDVLSRKMSRQNILNCFTSQNYTEYFKEEVILQHTLFYFHHRLIPRLSLDMGVDSLFSFYVQLEFQMLSGLVLRVITMFWLWIYWDQALKIFSVFVTGSCPSKLFWCLLIKWYAASLRHD